LVTLEVTVRQSHPIKSADRKAARQRGRRHDDQESERPSPEAEEWSASLTLRALVERLVDGELRDESLARMSDEEIEATLTEVPGIGPWTAHGFLIVALDRPDVLLSGDLALCRAVQHAYGFDQPPSEDEMVQVAERSRPYRSLAASYLFASEFEKGS
jgi:3-methyladenine DNA glycosylase/8-oxoguanine DNA glycosylase